MIQTQVEPKLFNQTPKPLITEEHQSSVKKLDVT